MKIRRIFTAMFLLAAVLASSAYADSVNIIDLGEGNYTSAGDMLINITGSKGETILKALEVIPDGGTIQLNGNFKLPKSINIKKPVTIRSINGSGLNAQGRDRVIRCEAEGIRLENLTCINGGGTWNLYRGGGIHIENASVDIINCKFMNNNALLTGGGVDITSYSSVRLENCEISGNTAGLNGAGIYSVGTNNVELINCSITDNTTSYGT